MPDVLLYTDPDLPPTPETRSMGAQMGKYGICEYEACTALLRGFTAKTVILRTIALISGLNLNPNLDSEIEKAPIPNRDGGGFGEGGISPPLRLRSLLSESGCIPNLEAGLGEGWG